MVKKKEEAKIATSSQLKGVGKSKPKDRKPAKAPRMPKPPSSASQLYMAERSVAIATANAQLGPAQVAALAKAEWERMHPDDQLPWAEQERLLQEKYAKAMGRYHERMRKFQAAAEEGGHEDDNQDEDAPEEDGNEEKRGRKRKKPKKEKDPNKPKKGLNPYLLFARERVKVIRASDPNIQQKNALAVATAEWKAMSDGQKRHYQDMAAKDKARYEAEMALYRQSKGEVAPESKPRAPKKGLNPFMFYSQIRTREIRAADPHIEQKVALRQASEEWKVMTELQKKPYLEMSAKDKVRHMEELNEFRKK